WQRTTAMQLYLNISPETQGFPSKYYTISDFESGSGQKALAAEIENLSSTFAEEVATLDENDSSGSSCSCFDARFQSVGDAVLFLVQALIQHTIGYIVFFDIGPFTSLMTDISKQSVKLLSQPSQAARHLRHSVIDLKEPLLLDVREAPTGAVSQLKYGGGPLLTAILDTAEQTAQGKMSEGEQSIIFLIEE